MSNPVVYLATGLAIVAGALLAFFTNRHITQQQEQISNRPHSSSKQSDESGNWQFIDTSLICSICHDNCQQNKAYLTCGHVFHRRCIKCWFNNSNEGICPNCSNPVKIA